MNLINDCRRGHLMRLPYLSGPQRPRDHVLNLLQAALNALKAAERAPDDRRDLPDATRPQNGLYAHSSQDSRASCSRPGCRTPATPLPYPRTRTSYHRLCLLVTLVMVAPLYQVATLLSQSISSRTPEVSSTTSLLKGSG